MFNLTLGSDHLQCGRAPTNSRPRRRSGDDCLNNARGQSRSANANQVVQNHEVTSKLKVSTGSPGRFTKLGTSRRTEDALKRCFGLATISCLRLQWLWVEENDLIGSVAVEAGMDPTIRHFRFHVAGHKLVILISLISLMLSQSWSPVSSSSYRIVSFTLLAMDLMTLISPLLSQVYVESRRLKDLVKGPTVSSQEPRQAQYTCGSRRLLVSFAAPRLHGSIKLSLFSQLLWHRLPFWPFPRLSHYRVKMSSCVELQRDDSSRSPPNSQMAAPGASRSTTSSSRLATTKTKKVSQVPKSRTQTGGM